MTPISKLEELNNLLKGSKMYSDRAEYECIFFDERCTIFAESTGTRRVMLPTDLIIEWVSAYDVKMITSTMSAREMRNIVSKNSDWAPYQHGFETHLKAIIYAWAKNKSRN